MNIELKLKIYKDENEMNIGDSTFQFLSNEVVFVEKHEKERILSFLIKTTKNEVITVKIEQPKN